MTIGLVTVTLFDGATLLAWSQTNEDGVERVRVEAEVDAHAWGRVTHGLRDCEAWRIGVIDRRTQAPDIDEGRLAGVVERRGGRHHECDEDCHYCSECYVATGRSICGQVCPHAECEVCGGGGPVDHERRTIMARALRDPYGNRPTLDVTPVPVWWLLCATCAVTPAEWHGVAVRRQ